MKLRYIRCLKRVYPVQECVNLRYFILAEISQKAPQSHHVFSNSSTIWNCYWKLMQRPAYFVVSISLYFSCFISDCIVDRSLPNIISTSKAAIKIVEDNIKSASLGRMLGMPKNLKWKTKQVKMQMAHIKITTIKERVDEITKKSLIKLSIFDPIQTNKNSTINSSFIYVKITIT